MRLVLGDRSFDVTCRAVVIGVIYLDDHPESLDWALTDAARLAAAGADALEVDRPAPPELVELADRLGVPLVDASVGLQATDLDHPSSDHAPSAAAAAAAVAVARGSRAVRTRHVAAVRRACDVVAAILAARRSDRT